MGGLRDVLQLLRDVETCRTAVAAPVTVPTAELRELLDWRNGFYAYHRGLHVFGGCSEPRYHSLEAWNAPIGWVSDYGLQNSGLFFFAEDSLGNQFAWDGRRVVRFLAETGEVEDMAADLEGFVSRICGEPEEELGLSVLERWARVHGPLPEGRHLFPRTPLVLGGSLNPSELVMVDPFESMAFKANLARQIADVPDGGQVELVVAPPPEKRES